MNPKFDQDHARVRAEYLSRLPNHLSLLQSLLSEPDTAQKRTEARKLAHRLKGSTGSHGLQQLSLHLGKIEELLSGVCDAPLEELRALLTSSNVSPKAHSPESTSQTKLGGVQVDLATKAGRVLLLNLEGTLAERCSRLLQQYSVQVFRADALEDALRVASSNWLDFVLVQTSVGDGMARTVERLRAAACNCWLPIGSFSTEASVLQHHQAASAGVDVFLSTSAPDVPIQEAFDQLFERSTQIAPKLLLVDDDPDLLQSLGALLCSVGMRTKLLSSPTCVLEALDAWDPDALVVDVDMPELRGTEIVSILRSSPRWQTLPIIMLTGSTDRNTRLACYRAGCDDFIAKPFDQEELIVRLQARVARKRVLMRSERDPLSGLILRRPFSLRSHMRTSEARRHRLPLSIAMLDLDRFKDVNDKHGHMAGDRVISTLGRLLRSRLREEDVAARWGGEEFALSLPHTDAVSAHHVVTDILDQLSALTFVGDGGEAFCITFSAGIATYPSDGDSLEQLLTVADRRLYEAKQAGRARVSSQPPGMVQ